jgi:hypothetical protein
MKKVEKTCKSALRPLVPTFFRPRKSRVCPARTHDSLTLSMPLRIIADNLYFYFSKQTETIDPKGIPTKSKHYIL